MCARILRLTRSQCHGEFCTSSSSVVCWFVGRGELCGHKTGPFEIYLWDRQAGRHRFASVASAVHLIIILYAKTVQILYIDSGIPSIPPMGIHGSWW